ALAAGSLPAALPAPPELLDPAVTLGLVLKEALVGLVLGAIVAFVLAAFDAAGQLTDLFRGSTLAEVLAGPVGGRTSPLGGFLALAALALLVASGGFLVLLGALIRSVEVFPVEAMPSVLLRPEGLVGGALALFGRSWEVGLLLAAPALGVSLLVDASLGLAARVSPGFEGYFLAMPLRAALGLGAMVVSLALVRPHLADLLRRAVAIVS
ncbi:MAG: flagellar biosynthetic protein FliR, partial [Myxococcota bacterium]|nr:flagellar biosynthetic protein FliR [Myxococcota bacterium]